MGKHSLQHCNVNIAIGHTSWQQLPSLPVSRLSDPDVTIHYTQTREMAANFVRFLPADALWNLAMAINVYLTLFKKYNAQQLKALEWRYHIMCYGAPFVVALTYLFISTPARGKMYGPATVNFPPKCLYENDKTDPSVSFGAGLTTIGSSSV